MRIHTVLANNLHTLTHSSILVSIWLLRRFWSLRCMHTQAAVRTARPLARRKMSGCSIPRIPKHSRAYKVYSNKLTSIITYSWFIIEVSYHNFSP